MTPRKDKLIQAACAIALSIAAPAALADTVTLTNGDSLTGSIIAHTEQALTLSHPILGEITLDANRIATVTRDQTPAVAGQETGSSAGTSDSGQAPPHPKPDPKATQQAAAEAAANASGTDPSFWQHFLNDWDSKLTLGLNGSAGPTERQDYRIKFKTKHEDGRERWTLDTSWYYATADNRQTQNQFQANFTKDWLQKDTPWFFFVQGRYQFDDNRSWENRTSAFGGGGYTLKKTDDIEVNTRLGFGGTYEYGSVNEFTPEALFGGSAINWHLTDRTTISGETVYFPSLEDSTNFRIESSLEWTYKLDLAKGLSLKLGLENEYDANTPNEDDNNAIKYYGAVVFSF